MPQQIVRFSCLSAFIAAGIVGFIANTPTGAFAQIVPDLTLGRERSVLRSNVPGVQGLIDRIDGGALRGKNLFHSFADFNVNPGKSVYFSNPLAVNNIISRVTGKSFSSIDGTLGVLGSANLFLINPNGIVFGANSRLDIRGSFVASTADKIPFADGYAFSATSPETEPLLTVSSPLGLASWQVNQGTISNQGSLSVGQDLSLLAAKLELQGELKAAGNLSLLATNALTAQDTSSQSFIASAGKQLLVQGNQSVKLDALTQPGSRLSSGGDMLLRSDAPIVGDTNFRAGGNFRVERLDGSLGSVRSLKDPVFETGGDFSLADYTGASLQILAGGSVSIPGTIAITGAGGPFNDSTVTLSNGSTLALQGTTVPTVDIRAGTTQFFGTPLSGSPTGASISIGSIINPGGLVYLTNQFQSNPILQGSISVDSIITSPDPTVGLNGGSVVIDSRNAITFNAIDVSGVDPATFDLIGRGGDVTLLAKNDISMPFPSAIFSYGLRGGNITLSSDTAIVQSDAPFGTDPFSLSTIESLSLGPDKGGDITLTAPRIAIGGNILTTTFGDAVSGSIQINADALTTSQATILTQTTGSGQSGNVTVNANSMALNYTFLGSASFGDGGGRGGDVTVQTNSLTGTTGAQISSIALGVGDAGNVNVTASDINLSGFQPGDLTGGVFAASSISSASQLGATGNGGNVTVTTNRLTLKDAAVVATSTYGQGNAGNITINAADSINVDGAAFIDFATPPLFPVQPSAIQSEVFTGAVGRGGQITVTTPVLNVTNGGTITSSTGGEGNAGSINITATQSATFDGVASFPGLQERFSRAAVITTQDAVGNAGSLTITTPSLSLTNGGRLTAETEGQGNAGNLQVNVSNTLFLSGSKSGILASTALNSTGNGGSIFVSKNPITTIQNGAQITAATQGTGKGGDVQIEANSLSLGNGGQVTVETQGPGSAGSINLQLPKALTLDGPNTGLIARTAPGSSGAGGSILINSPESVQVLNGAQITAETQGSGPGGSIQLRANSLAAVNGGRLTVETQGPGNAGSINLQVQQSLSLNGPNAGIIARTGPTSSGQGGDILIGNPETLQVLNGAQITAATQGTGKGGNVQVQANSLSLGNGGQVTVETQGPGSAGSINLQLPKALTLDGPNAGLIARTAPGSSGAGGNILINSPEVVQILNGAQITAETQGSGPGGSIQLKGGSLSQINGGTLTVATKGAGNAGSIDLRLGGPVLLNGFNSGLLALTSPASSGSGGKINIQTLGTVNILNSAQIAASTQGSGPGGNIDINARAINLDANGQITAGTKGQGAGGNITLTANRIDVANGAQVTGQTQGSGNAGNIRLTVDEALNLSSFESGIFANTGPDSTGNGGDISVISLRDINIQNGARIAVDSQGQGAGGNIRVQTRSINLNNFGVITAETASTKGGNISIFSSDPLYMTNNSRISTTAGTAKAGGDGGNIVIRAPFLISGATDNSDITANAYSGRGGRVEITTNGILGMIVRSRSDLETALGTSDPNRLDPALLPTSDITAISQTNPNLNGVVDIRSLDSDPFQNVYVLPSTTVDASKLVAKGCSTGPTVAKAPGTLVVTGRGGLPPSPTDQLNSSGLVLGWESPGKSATSSHQPSPSESAQAQPAPKLIVEAGAIALGPNGQVSLVAKATGGDQGTFANQGQVCSVQAEPTGSP